MEKIRHPVIMTIASLAGGGGGGGGGDREKEKELCWDTAHTCTVPLLVLFRCHGEGT